MTKDDRAPEKVMDKFVAQGGWDGPWMIESSHNNKAVKQASNISKSTAPNTSPKGDLKTVLASTRHARQLPISPTKGR